MIESEEKRDLFPPMEPFSVPLEGGQKEDWEDSLGYFGAGALARKLELVIIKDPPSNEFRGVRFEAPRLSAADLEKTGKSPTRVVRYVLNALRNFLLSSQICDADSLPSDPKILRALQTLFEKLTERAENVDQLEDLISGFLNYYKFLTANPEGAEEILGKLNEDPATALNQANLQMALEGVDNPDLNLGNLTLAVPEQLKKDVRKALNDLLKQG